MTQAHCEDEGCPHYGKPHSHATVASIGPLTLSRSELARLIGADLIMASTAVQPEGHWRIRADQRWEFVPDENEWTDA
jgi:hypothetical protein